jgi:hypothetical protein
VKQGVHQFSYVLGNYLVYIFKVNFLTCFRIHICVLPCKCLALYEYFWTKKELRMVLVSRTPSFYILLKTVNIKNVFH